jgi:C1A family cysteine protease
VVASVAVYTSFDAPRSVRRGVVADPGPRDAVRGSLAICIVGYDNARRRFKFLNSWGRHWGVRGYGYLSYDYVQHYGSDAWAVSA